MRAFLRFTCAVVGLAACLLPHPLMGQVVINEIVEDEQDFESGDITPDTREFIELYNAGNSAAEIGSWTLNYYMLTGGEGDPVPGAYFEVVDMIPSGTMLGPGEYYVVGATDVPNVNLDLGADIDLFPNSTSAQGGTIFELWNGDRDTVGNSIVDAVAIDTFRNSELANANQAQLDQIAAGQTVGPDARGGWWGQVESNDAHPSDPTFPNLPMSIGRYLDGLDRNVNGRDFGMIPATPGTSNNLAQVAVHEVTDVDSLATDTVLRDDYYASFKLPRVIEPGTTSVYNPNPISTLSPQGGKAIVAWDETGGGNAVYSDEYSNEFKLYAYIDPRPFTATALDTTQSEASIYGIGTTDLFFGTPNSADLLTLTSSINGSTGVGWLIQRRTTNTEGELSSAAVLQLIDFNDGGDSVLADNDWQVIESIDLTEVSEGWHQLGVKYDPATGNVTAVYDDQTFEFTTSTDLIGNFYIGYRENLTGANGDGAARPPTYDLIELAPPGGPGDYNDNGIVDAADYVVWRNGGPLANETVTLGMVTDEDYNVWRANFGKPTPPGSGQVAAVPEPAAVALVVVGMLMAATFRRQDR